MPDIPITDPDIANERALIEQSTPQFKAPPAATVPETTPPGTPVPMKSPIGRIESVPSEQVGEKGLQGYVAATPSDIASEKYGTLGQTALGFGEQAAGAATMDFSKLLEQRFGVPAADIAGRAENLGPVGRGIADVGGFATLAALTGGLGAGEEAIAGAAKVPFGGALAEMLGTSVAGKVAAGAASMAAYTAGQSVAESEIGDTPFLSEATLMNVGMGAVLGGGLEGLFGLVGQALPENVGASKSAFATLDELGKKLTSKALIIGGAPADTVNASLEIAQEAAAAKMSIPDYLAADAKKANKETVDAITALRKGVVDGRNSESLSAWWAKNRMPAIQGALEGTEGTVPAAAELSNKIAAMLEIPEEEKVAHGFRVRTVANPQSPEELLAQAAEAKAAGGEPFAPPSNVRYSEPQLFKQVRAINENFNNAVAKAEGTSDEAFQVFQAADKARTDLAPLRYVENSRLKVKGQLGKWVGDVQRTFATFTKDPAVFGDQIKPIWGDTQDAWHTLLDADGSLTEGLGKGPKGAKVLSHQAFAKDFTEGAANVREGLGATPKAELRENWLKAVKDFSDKVEQAAQETPKVGAYDTASINKSLNSLNELKAGAMAKFGMADAFNHLPGGKKLALGGLWIPSLVLKHFGLPSGAMPFVLGAIEAGRLVARPAATIAAYGKLANFASVARKAIGSGAGAAAKAMTGLKYGAAAAPRAAYYESVEKGFRQSILGGKKAESLNHAGAQHAQDIYSLGGPEDLGARLGQTLAPLPPNTRQATATLVGNQLQLRKSILAPKPPTLGGFQARASDADAFRQAQLTHHIDNPLSLLKAAEHGRLTPEHVAISQAANPRLHQEMVSQIDNELAKRGMHDMGPVARAQYNILHGSDPWPMGLVEANQIGYGMPAPESGIQQPMDTQGRRGTHKVAAMGGATRKFQSDLLTKEKLPMDVAWKPA